jgi:hypothetical protein
MLSTAEGAARLIAMSKTDRRFFFRSEDGPARTQLFPRTLAACDMQAVPSLRATAADHPINLGGWVVHPKLLLELYEFSKCFRNITAGE